MASEVYLLLLNACEFIDPLGTSSGWLQGHSGMMLAIFGYSLVSGMTKCSEPIFTFLVLRHGISNFCQDWLPFHSILSRKYTLKKFCLISK